MNNESFLSGTFSILLHLKEELAQAGRINKQALNFGVNSRADNILSLTNYTEKTGLMSNIFLTQLRNSKTPYVLHTSCEYGTRNYRRNKASLLFVIYYLYYSITSKPKQIIQNQQLSLEYPYCLSFFRCECTDNCLTT